MKKQYALLLNIVVLIMCVIFFINNIIDNQLYTVSSLLCVLIVATSLFNLFNLKKENNNKDKLY